MTRDEWKKTPVAEQDNARLWKPNHSFLIDQWWVSASEMVGLGGIGCRFWGGFAEWIVEAERFWTTFITSPHPNPLPEGEGTDRVVWERYTDVTYRGELGS